MARWLSALVLALGLYAGSASAIPLDVNESSFGDFTGQDVGVLDVGVNLISGQIVNGDVSDTFNVTLPAGLSMASLLVSVTNFVNGSAAFSTVLTPIADLEFDTNGQVVELEVDPATPGPLVLNLGVTPGTTVIADPPSTTQDLFSYTFQIVVVPEPGAGALVALGLFAAGLARRLRTA